MYMFIKYNLNNPVCAYVLTLTDEERIKSGHSFTTEHDCQCYYL